MTMLTTTTLAASVSDVPTTLQIDTLQAVIATAVFLVSLGIAWGTLRTSVKHITNDVGDLKGDMKDIRERFATLEGKSSGLYQSQSPVNLTKFGEKALDESGLRKYIDDNQDVLMQACETHRELPTSYDVQECVFEFMDEYEFPDSIESSIKNYAFDHGLTMDNMRRVAALHLRNIILGIKGYDPEDIDRK